MAEPLTAESTEQRVPDEGRAARDGKLADRNQMAAQNGGQLPPVPGEGQPLEEQPGQDRPKDPAAFGPDDGRPMESRVAGDDFTTP